MSPTPPQRTISPRNLAEAIGMSESSLKRWADRGLLAVTRTAGGHRRIGVQDAVRFIRDRKLDVLKPSLLGLPGSADSYAGSAAGTNDTFLDALISGDLELAQSFIISRYMSGSSIAEIGDGPMKSALHYLGEQGHSGDMIMVEHRATELCIQVVHQLRMLATPSEFSFTAVGGGVSGDPYTLPSLLVSSVVTEHGGDATNFGPNTPFEAMRHQTTLLPEDRRPDVVWISVSQTDNARELSKAISTFSRECAECGMHVVIGGRSVGELSIEPVEGMSIHATLASLAASIQAFSARIDVA